MRWFFFLSLISAVLCNVILQKHLQREKLFQNNVVKLEDFEKEEIMLGWFWDDIPQQVHLAYGDNPQELNIVWSTRKEGDSTVDYGTSEKQLTLKAKGICQKFTQGNALGKQYIHRVKLQGLNTGQKYFYQVATNGKKSEIFSVTTMKAGVDWVPHFLVYGDLGRVGGEPSFPSLLKAVHASNSNVTAIIHVGDFAYDLDTLWGLLGDSFMRRLQQLAAFVPYMTAVGNHELAYDYSHYLNRFWMPGANNTMWYSWNIANIHFISYSTEVYFQNSTIFTVERQLAWLKKDLAQANKERNVRPWIIAFGHRPFYCSNTDGDDCDFLRGIVRLGLEDLFYQQGVDLIIEAHEHSYERLWPVYNGTVTQTDYINPRAPVHIISGAAGCNENWGKCVNPLKGPGGPWSAFRSSGTQTYGYGRMFAPNNTHLYFEEIVATENDKILDSFWMVQENHGPFVSSSSEKLSAQL